jgi:DNA mismatch repair protein MutS2
MMQTPKIDVHGMTREEALSSVRINLPGFASRGYNEVFIVHGHGKNILKDSIRNLLRQLSYVKSIRIGKQNEGGDGVTIVSFK